MIGSPGERSLDRSAECPDPRSLRELRLAHRAGQYGAIAQAAAERKASFIDFLEDALRTERDARRARAREMFARVAGFPAIKTIDGDDFGFATGTPRPRS